ncbi:MAG TPA: DUF3578 domain-containing protein [Micromonosporaceae bacterium]
MRLRSLIGKIGAKYDRQLPMSSEAQGLLRRAGVEFEQWIPAGHRAQGSGGRGRAAVIPSIVIFTVGEEARSGLFVAYLFAADMSTVTLSLNQGINEIAEEVGRAEARRTLASAAADIRAALRPKDVTGLDATCDLRSTTQLAVDYERANILSRTYRLDALPDERTMITDLRRFIRMYARALDARARVGQRLSSRARATPASKPAQSAHPTRLITRRRLLVGLVSLPAAFVVPAALGLELLAEDEKPKPPPPPPGPAPQFTIDVSQHDWDHDGGNLDWTAVRRAGIDGMCARATYGDPSGFTYPTYHFGDFVRGANDAGFLLRGGYHNLVRGEQASINRQVDWLRQELDAHDANWALLDVERYAEMISAGAWPRWDDVRRFDDRWAAVDDRVLVGYVPPWNWRNHLGQPDLREFRGPLIASAYPLDERADEYQRLYARCGGDHGPGWAPYGNRVSEGWQYSSRARVPGAASVYDMTAWRISPEQLYTMLVGDRG